MAFLIFTVSAFAQEGRTLTWKLALLRWDGLTYDSLPFSRPVTLAADEEFQVYVQAESSCYCYVVGEDPDGRASVLAFERLRGGSPLALPSENDNYKLSPSMEGGQRIHVVVSLDRQKELEDLLAALRGVKGDGMAESRATLDEIARLKQSASGLAEAPEKPVPIGGTIRGAKEPQATEYSGQRSYAKTIRLER